MDWKELDRDEWEGWCAGVQRASLGGSLAFAQNAMVPPQLHLGLPLFTLEFH